MYIDDIDLPFEARALNDTASSLVFSFISTREGRIFRKLMLSVVFGRTFI